MRKVITVTTASFDIGSAKPQIGKIVAAFDRYLDDYPVKNARSKHGLMGPVARILDRAKAGGYTEEALIGDAMRVHEMNPKSRNYLSPIAQRNLEDGTRLLLELCRETPTTALVRVIDQIDYSLYYARRTRSIIWLEEKRMLFAEFLRKRYANDEGFQRAWARSKDAKRLKLDSAPFPRRSGDDYSRDQQRKTDIDEFWGSVDPEEIVDDTEEEVRQ
jgi:hypothetical protein